MTGSSASAVTLGVGWSGNAARDIEEMPLVAASGAAAFRVPQGAIGDALVEAAARNHVTILAQLGGGTALPANRSAFRAEVGALVKRYGVNGSFWPEHPDLPAEPITVWEVWNEPNGQEIGPAEYGTFLQEVAETIHLTSLGGSPEVLFGGLLADGDLGPTTGTWQQMEAEGKGTTLTAALRYLEEAYGMFAATATEGVPNVAGIAIHPYELNEASFFTPPGGARYSRIEAFRYAVGMTHAKLVELASSDGGGQKSLSISETGWPAEGNEWSVGEAEQARLLGQVITYAKNNEATLNIKNLDWYNFRDASGEAHEWARYCGLRAADGHFRTAWTEFQAKAGVRQWIPQVPTAETGLATETRSSQARLNGIVNPRGLPTKFRFEYGTSTSYGRSTPVPEGDMGASQSPVPESGSAILQPGMTYHYRISATNAVGVSHGSDVTFATPPVVAYQSQLGELWTTSVPSNAENQHLGMGTEGSQASVASLANGGYETAFRAYGNELWTFSPGVGGTNLHLGMMPGSTPDIAALPGGGYVIAFQADTGELWVYSSVTGAENLHQGMGYSASSPSIAVRPDGTYVIAFRAYGDVLDAYSQTSGPVTISAPMMAGASPDIAPLQNGQIGIAFQSAAGELNVYSSATGPQDLHEGMGYEASTPSIVELGGNSWEIAFRAIGGELWVYSSFSGAQNLHEGMGTTPTVPSIAAIPGGGYEIAFKSASDELWTYNSFTGSTDTGLALRPESSPSLGG